MPFLLQGLHGNWRAHVRLWTSLGATVISLLLLYFLPWYLAPIGWLALGSAMFAASSVVSSCALGTFCKSSWLNSTVGTILGLPLLLSFNSLRVGMHDATESLVSAADSSIWFLSGFWTFHRTNFRTCVFNFHFMFIVILILSFSVGVSKLTIFNNVLLYTFVFALVSGLYFLGGLPSIGKYYLAPLVVFYLWHSVSIKVGRTLQITIRDDEKIKELVKMITKQYEHQDLSLPNVARIISKATKLMHRECSRPLRLFEKIVGWEQIVPCDVAFESLQQFKMVEMDALRRKVAALSSPTPVPEPAVEVINTDSHVNNSWDTYSFVPSKVC
jgi:hypothetical protein